MISRSAFLTKYICKICFHLQVALSDFSHQILKFLIKIGKKSKYLNRSNKKNNAGLGIRKYSTTTKNINFKDSTMNAESIKLCKLNETKLDSTSKIKTIDKDLNDRNFYFQEIKQLFKNNEFNENTQKNLETLGFQHKRKNDDNIKI